MKKYLYLVVIALFVYISAAPAGAFDVFKKYEKVIWIDQVKQIGIAYDEGKKLFEFPIISGDAKFTTDPGIYVVKMKDENYYSRKYDTPMPYSIFFDLKRREAIHEGAVPPPTQKKELATHGCIHVAQPYIEWLYDWADVGDTAVVIYGWRTGN